MTDEKTIGQVLDTVNDLLRESHKSTTLLTTVATRQQQMQSEIGDLRENRHEVTGALQDHAIRLTKLEGQQGVMEERTTGISGQLGQVLNLVEALRADFVKAIHAPADPDRELTIPEVARVRAEWKEREQLMTYRWSLVIALAGTVVMLGYTILHAHGMM